MHRALRLFAGTLAVAIAGIALLFGLLQTPFGRTWFAHTVSEFASTREFSLQITDLNGLVPFHMTAEQVAIRDATGTWATLNHFKLDLSAADLLRGRAHLTTLSAGEVDVARQPGGKSTPLPQLIRDLHLPVPLVIDRLAIGRLVLAPPLLGERVVATLSGRAASVGKNVGARLDLHRIDQAPGKLALDLELVGQTLTLHLKGQEPSGLLLNRLLGRTDHLPVSIALDGVGPIADWHGRLIATAGNKARIAVDLTAAVTSDAKRLGLHGTATIAQLLPGRLAPLIGEHARFAIHLTARNAITVDSLSVATVAGTLTGHGAYRGPRQPIRAEARLHLPDLARFASLLGRPLAGTARMHATLSGSGSQPRLKAEIDGSALRIGNAGVNGVSLRLSATPSGAIADPKTRFDILARGRIVGIAPPAGTTLPAALSRDIDWSLAAVAAPADGTLTVTRLTAKGAGIEFASRGQLARGGRSLIGQASLKIADLRPFSGLLGRPIGGAVTLDATAQRQGADGFTASLTGSARELRTGIAAVDAALGKTATLTASAERRSGSASVAGRIALAGVDATAEASGTFALDRQQLSATVKLDLPRLAALGSALAVKRLGGKLAAHATVTGPLDHLRAQGALGGSGLTLANARLDRLQLNATIANLTAPEAKIDGSFRAGRLDGTVTLTAGRQARSRLTIPHLTLAAAGSRLDGRFDIALDTGRIDGSLRGKAPDLARWSALAGLPLAGSLEFSADFSDANGETIALRVSGRRLAAGKRAAIGGLKLDARLAGLLSRPTGKGGLTVSDARLSSGTIETATLAFDSPQPGRFTFRASSKGRPVSASLTGNLAVADRRVDLAIDRLSGAVAETRFRLAHRLTVAKHGDDFAFSDLDLRIGKGRITGSGRAKGERLALALRGSDLPLGAGAQLTGDRKLHGFLGFAARLDGTLTAPRGHVTLDGRELRVGLPRAGHLSQLGLSASADWNGREIDAKGRISGLSHDRLTFSGHLPLRLTRAPLALSMPRDSRLSLKLDGSGEIANLAPLLPLDEDRLSGRFKIDVAVGGTVAAPQATGHLTLSDGRYENFATGAVLTGIRADLTGNRDRFTLSSFSAGDDATGHLEASGSLLLDTPGGPTAQLSATLDKFRVAARDEAVATASGQISITGPLAAPKVAAKLRIDKAALQLPARLPHSVTKLDVVVVGGAKKSSAAQPALPATLDIEIAMPGQVFVRGHGLDSEWRGQLAITGTSAAPRIAGSLHEVRGTFALLGKSFQLESGSTITFTGAAKPDPALNITAAASAADITARVQIGGLASAPTIKLSSTPALPQDEILSRVLFNQGASQLTVGEGIQLAQAAAELAGGGGPGLLDRLRGSLGLDRLSFGSGAGGPASSTLNPGLSQSTTGTTAGTTLSGGKYVAPGVYVGVTQGTSTEQSKATVQIEVLPHFNVETDVGEGGGTGIGLNYKYDY